MAERFSFQKDPPPAALTALSLQAPHNPFFTLHYGRARTRMGDTLWLFKVQDAGEGDIMFPVFVRFGRVNRTAEVPSCPALRSSRPFNEALSVFCREQRITGLNVNTFASAAPAPLLETAPYVWSPRWEYVLNLQDKGFEACFSQQHIRNLRKSHRAELRFHLAADADACYEHLQLFSSSVNRRVERGEPLAFDESPSWLIPFVDERAAVVVQAVGPAGIAASILLLVAPKGAYYYSSGVNEYGRSVGAAHFLVAAAARYFSRQGWEVLNLGGARESETGLSNFKSGFGGRRIALNSAEYRLGGKVTKLVNYIASLNPVQPAAPPASSASLNAAAAKH